MLINVSQLQIILKYNKCDTLDGKSSNLHGSGKLLHGAIIRLVKKKKCKVWLVWIMSFNRPWDTIWTVMTFNLSCKQTYQYQTHDMNLHILQIKWYCFITLTYVHLTTDTRYFHDVHSASMSNCTAVALK